MAGATEERGEDHRPETHIIPVALQALLGKRETFTVYGTDYPTPDGTAIRDYVHVVDLADAHIEAIERLDTRWGRSTSAPGTDSRSGKSSTRSSG